MKKYVLIACSSKKLSSKARAENLYSSSLFEKSLDYAKTLNPDGIFVLSAKHRLLRLDKKINPYNQTLNNMPIKQRKKWADNVIKKLKELTDLKKDKFVFLAGNKYREFLIDHMANYEVPLDGLPIGKQLKFLKAKTKNLTKCDRLHKLFSKLKRFHFPFKNEDIPKNGIYILFEKGEKGHGVDRIVRVGIHKGDNQLKPRLRQHFINPNKDRSIFRKNIGRSILNRENDPYLKIWEIDFTSKKIKAEKGKLLDSKKQRETEEKVSDQIQKNFSLIVFPIDKKEKREDYESKLISTVSLCKKCKPSASWFGHNSPIEKIRNSGLWLVQGLYGKEFSNDEFENFGNMIKEKKGASLLGLLPKHFF